jgi:hypothetical protein
MPLRKMGDAFEIHDLDSALRVLFDLRMSRHLFIGDELLEKLRFNLYAAMQHISQLTLKLRPIIRIGRTIVVGKNPMQEVVIAGAARTPVGAFNGGLSGVAASYLGTVAIKEALKRAKTDAADVDEVLLGQILTAGTGQNPARQAAIEAGVPVEATAVQINQLCGSGLRAVAMGMQSIKLGDTDVVVAGGQESMS